jgi:hypothetical protein
MSNYIEEFYKLNQDYNAKLKVYDETLRQYNAYSKSPVRSPTDYEYWTNHRYSVNFATLTGTSLTQPECLTSCVGNPNCLGASFLKPASGINGTCYVHTTLSDSENVLKSDDSYTAIIDTKRYYVLQLQKINNELLKLNGDRISFFDKNKEKLTNNQTDTQNSIKDFNAANDRFKTNNNMLKNELTKLGTTDETNMYSSTIYKQENLQFQLLLIVLYAIVFFVFTFFNIDSFTSKIILIVVAIMTFIIIFNNLYQYMQ